MHGRSFAPGNGRERSGKRNDQPGDNGQRTIDGLDWQGRPIRRLVLKVPRAGEDHGQLVLVGGGDDFVVLTEPPGWMIAVAPALAISSMPSRNGKKASDAATVPASGSCALSGGEAGGVHAAHLPGADAHRLHARWRRRWRCDFTCFTTVQARSSAFHSSSLGLRFVTTSHFSRSRRCRSQSCSQQPAHHAAQVEAGDLVDGRRVHVHDAQVLLRGQRSSWPRPRSRAR